MNKAYWQSAALVAGLLGSILNGVAWSQTYPDRPIRLVVQGLAASTPDIIMRPIARFLSQSLGQPVIVDNRPGAGGMVAAQTVMNSPADGYTILVASSGTMSIAPFLMKKQPYDPLGDFVPVTLVAIAPLIVTANPTLPASSMKELIALAKSDSRGIRYGTPGVGTVQHLTMEMLSQAAAVSLSHIPYKGGAAVVTDAMGGHVQLAITAIPAVLPQLKSTHLKALGVTSARRSPVLPEVPTIAESGLVGFEAATWYAMYAPRNTPAAIIDRLVTEMRKAADASEVKAVAAQEGVDLEVGGARTLEALQRADTAKWRRIIRESKIVLE